MITSEKLSILLKDLRLGTMRTNWEDLAERAETHHWTYEQYLTLLADMELTSRNQRRIQQHITESKLPLGKTLDTFEFSGLSSITGAQISGLADSTNWVSQAHNLILFGPSGVGKSHLAAAIGRRLIEKGLRVLFVKTTSLVQRLQTAYKRHELSELIAKLAKFDLLILDDIGYIKRSKSETSVLFELIGDRYESKSLLITANQPFDKWDEVFPNKIMAVAAIDRLVHHATIINIDEPSYRTSSKLGKNKQHRGKQ